MHVAGYVLVGVLSLAACEADLCSWYGKGCPGSGTTIDVSPLTSLTGTIDSTWFATLSTAGQATLLRISKNACVTAISPGAFNALTSCTTIDLSENGITAIASGVFDPLSKLQTLYLTTNRIAQPLPVSGLPSNLVYLWCGVNQIPSITPGTFDSLSQLRTLWLGANQLTALPAHIFDRLTVLKALDLGQNQLQRLPVGVFDYLTSLNTLLLWVNLLTTVAPGTFRALTQLQSLTVSSNPLLVTLDAYLFQSLTNYDPTATLDVSYSMTDLVCVPYPPPITFVAPAAYITGGRPYCPAPSTTTSRRPATKPAPTLAKPTPSPRVARTTRITARRAMSTLTRIRPTTKARTKTSKITVQHRRTTTSKPGRITGLPTSRHPLPATPAGTSPTARINFTTQAHYGHAGMASSVRAPARTSTGPWQPSSPFLRTGTQVMVTAPRRHIVKVTSKGSSTTGASTPERTLSFVETTAGIATIGLIAGSILVLCMYCCWALWRRSMSAPPATYLSSPAFISTAPTATQSSIASQDPLWQYPLGAPMSPVQVSQAPPTSGAQVNPQYWSWSSTTSGSSSQGTLLHKTSPVIQHFDMPATTPAMHYFNVPATTPAASSMQNFDVPESATSPQTPGSKPGKPSLRHQRRQVARDKFDQGAMTSTVSSDAE